MVSGTDVYVCGAEASPSDHDAAKYWKNGVAVTLTDGTNKAFANAILLSGSDVYVTGYEFNGKNFVAKLWKNGVATDLSDGSKRAQATGIFLAN